MLIVNFFQRVGLDPDGRDLIDMFAVILKDNPALQFIREISVLIGIQNNGMGKADDKFII